MKKIIYTSLCLLALSISNHAFAQNACTMEARMCPNGTFVGRTGPNCEFAPCGDTTTVCTTDVQSCPDGSFVSRSGPNCAFTECPTTVPTPTPAPSFCPNLYSTIRLGQTNTQVSQLQKFLFAKYNIPTKSTGYFGTITRNNVIKFQKEYALTPDGIVGRATRAAIKNVCQENISTLPKVTPANCKVWFDGCNTCARQNPGGPMACTLMACVWANSQAATCKEYF